MQLSFSNFAPPPKKKRFVSIPVATTSHTLAISNKKGLTKNYCRGHNTPLSSREADKKEKHACFMDGMRAPVRRTYMSHAARKQLPPETIIMTDSNTQQTATNTGQATLCPLTSSGLRLGIPQESNLQTVQVYTNTHTRIPKQQQARRLDNRCHGYKQTCRHRVCTVVNRLTNASALLFFFFNSTA